MQIVHGGAMEFVERPNPRGGSFHTKALIEGEPGSAANYFLSLSRTFEDFESPRHRHNFDQIRVQISGECAFGRDGTMTPGTIGYFPEGTFYGPQSAEGEAIVLVLQFGGASGNGYMAEAELQRNMADLKRVGEFKSGVYYRHEGDGRARQDAYEAAWENWSGRRMVYPAPRYGAPILIQPAGFRWLEAAPGVRLKRLGSFSEAETTLALLELEAGSVFRLDGDVIAYVLSGEGRLGDETLRPGSALHLAPHEGTRMTASAPIEILLIDRHPAALQAAAGRVA